ncbi:RNA recognition motif domain-containing protein [Aliidiomarina soli]|nr:RNA-binding protein [Aliidiomarina soli]
MTRATPASQILVAAIIAIVAGLLSGLMTSFDNTTTISLVGLFSFLSGLLTPWIAAAISAPKSKRAAKPKASKRETVKPTVSGHNPDGSDQMTLYVGNLPFKTSEESVEETFARYGEVFAVRLVKDRRTGKRKGYGFVEMEPVGAELALSKLNDSEYEGRTLKVRFANTERKE